MTSLTIKRKGTYKEIVKYCIWMYNIVYGLALFGWSPQGKFAPEAGKVWEREKSWGSRVKLLLGVAMVSVGWSGSEGKRSRFVCPFCSVRFIGSRLGCWTLTHILLYTVIALCPQWGKNGWLLSNLDNNVDPVKDLQTYQVNHPAEIQSTIAAGRKKFRWPLQCRLMEKPLQSLDYCAI